jgi:DNA mismatch repair protein MutL
MGRIHVLPEHVANKIAAGEVVERPASVVKELLENALDAGATRIKINIEAGGKKLIQVTDNGCGMVRDDAMLAFERHATSKIRDAEDLLSVATLGFRGEALPSIASVSRLRLETCAALTAPISGTEKSPPPPKDGLDGTPKFSELQTSGTIIEINGGRMARVEEAGLPRGTSITVRDLFFNIPARKKFLKAEPTELSHIASLVTHYALAHPEKHFELHSATNAMLVAPPVAGYSERVYQVLGKETLDQLIAVAAAQALEHVGLPQPPPWRKRQDDEGESDAGATPGEMRLHGFVSKPEIQKLNRNSIFVFVNGRLIRDRLVQHGLTEAYRNIIPPSVYPVVLLFMELPPGEVDVNVHPSKTEVRFRQPTVMHDFVRDTVRAALMKARPAPQFTTEIRAHATASEGLTPGAREWEPPSDLSPATEAPGRVPYEITGGNGFALPAPAPPPISARLQFDGGIAVEANAAIPVARGMESRFAETVPDNGCAAPLDTTQLEAQELDQENSTLDSLATLRPLGQIRNSFILAVNEDGLWIIDQHVAHERVLFERILKQRAALKVESQRLLMPIVLELSPAQQAVFTDIANELQHNGFEAEPFGARSVAVKVAPAGVDAAQVEHMLHELLDQISREEQSLNLEKIRGRIAASIACHAAIKVNMPLEQNKMDWLLAELAKTDHPMSCPHGRPVVLRYSVKDIQKAFKRI